MSFEIAFHGAAGVVTGSCMELRSQEMRILVDCGLFQGSRSLEALNYETLPFDPQRIDLVILTHAHLDHSGRLPLLMREGCAAEIWCTPPNRQLLKPLLTDAANLQAADAERRNERPDRAGLKPFEALYDFTDVETVIDQIQTLDYGRFAEPRPGVALRFWDAHHIQGAASVELHIDGQALLFSGDIGPAAADADGPSSPAGGWDHVVCEATYGDRDRVVPSVGERREALAVIVGEALAHGGNLVVPAFALERTQVILEDLVALFETGRLPGADVYVDAPLADKITQAYRRFQPQPRGTRSPFDHPRIKFTSSVAESRALNHVSGAIILAGSGMCNGGRVRYHLLRNLPRAESTVLFVGYQAQGTLGAVLRGGAKAVRISGNDVRVRSKIVAMDGYSGHADHAGLLRWLQKRGPVTGSLFLDHGETASLSRLEADLQAISGLPRPFVPALGETYILDAHTNASKAGPPRPDVASLVGDDWHGRAAAFRSTLDERLAALPADRREAALKTLEAALVPSKTEALAA